MPKTPLVFTRQMLGGPHFACQGPQHEKRKLGRGFGKNISSMGEGKFVTVGISPVDVVKTNGHLRHNFEGIFAGGEDLGIDGIA